MSREGWFSANFEFDFFLTLNVKSAPIYRGGRGNLVFTGEQIPALDSTGKDLNHWLKVGMVHCQFAAAGCLRWPLWSGATSVYVPVSR